MRMRNYTFIDTEAGLEKFKDDNLGIDWMCFDTEFVGEKRYYTLLCVIQIKTQNGNYVIDPLQLSHIDPVLDMLADPQIVTITHAGENDYRLLARQYDLTPVNTFDTQIAAAFIGYKYPVSFQKLVSSELNIQLSKGYTVTNWEARPLSKQQIDYALDDILPLYDLWQKQRNLLLSLDRLHWAEEEFQRLEESAHYEKTAYDEALQSNLMHKSNRREKIFLLRLYKWRREVAAFKNYSKEMILPSKLIGHIVKGMRSGKKALKDNRRLPNNIIEQQWETFQGFYQADVTQEERDALKKLKKNRDEDPKTDLLYEILYSVIKYKCLEEDVAASIAFPRGDLKKIKENPLHAEHLFGKGWRQEFFGKTFTDWLKHFGKLDIEIGQDIIQLKKNLRG